MEGEGTIKKAGFVVILGRPNVGKSTLLNRLVGSKLAIVTPKPQTTRDAIQGVLTRSEGQIVFVDSPGIHEPSLELGRRMMSEVRRATSGCHLVLLVVDANKPAQIGDDTVIDMVKELKTKVFLVLNKVDLLKSKEQLLPRIEQYQQRYAFDEYIPLSAQTGQNTEELIREVFRYLPESPAYYPDDYITDQPERFLASELIREQIIFETQQEVPHSTAVMIDAWEETGKLLRMAATIYTERDSQKAILIGKKGAKMKAIGIKARKQLEDRFGKQVYLELFVKVQPRWRDQAGFIQSLDFRGLSVGDIDDDDAPDAPLDWGEDDEQ